MKYGVIIAARMGSRRLPGKALLTLKGLPMIVFLIRRLLGTKLADGIFLATTNLAEDDILAAVVSAEGIKVFRGKRDDLVQRYVDAAEKFGIEYVVRVTGDCPFVNAESLDYCLKKCEEWGDFDLASTKGEFPVGIDFEIYNHLQMRKLCRNKTLSLKDREHLTLYFHRNRNRFNVKKIVPKKRWIHRESTFTVDTPDDYMRAEELAEHLLRDDFSIEELIVLADAWTI
ncbi:MAG: NTP transferase domain-containing protein, partial [Nitrospinaceae bacterium]|nr:NTP transferase domain-containing protein [Nitrospinaceae bacterium]